ncbi:MAG: SDR family oxidoreductase [Actinomycetota bacterium]|nr:SDR family oxidoreductase [Actinomycetota bacterium]
MHAVVTGGAQGIGYACAEKLLSLGWIVTILDINSDKLKKAANELHCDYAQVDVTDQKSVRQFFSEIVSLDALINNAGIWRPQQLEEVSIRDQEDVVNVNLMGTLICTKAALPSLFNSSRGNIVNLSSLAARTKSPGLGLYAASKSAIETLTKQWAVEIAPIRVNAIAPGLILTEGTGVNYQGDMKDKRANAVPLKRVGEAIDVANAAAFLVSEDASYVTGQIIDVDGGLGSGSPQR